MSKKAFTEALKEIGRLAALAAIPLFIDMLIEGTINWELVGVTALIAALKGVDKYLHKVGQETKNESLTKGLTRF